MSKPIIFNQETKKRKPFEHIFKGDTLNKYSLVEQHKHILNINNNDALIYLAVQFPDYNKQQNYKFFKVPLIDIKYLCNKLLKNDNKIFEILIHDKPIKPFMDLEKKLFEQNTPEQNEQLLNKFLTFYKQTYFKYFNIELLDEDLIILNSCGKIINNTDYNYKFSYHVIINNDIYFKNMVEQSIFIKHVKECILKTGDDDLKILDDGVYSHDRYMRMINQCKFYESNRPLINNQLSIKDTFIINYFVTDETKYLNMEELKIKYKLNKLYANKKNSNEDNNEVIRQPLFYFNDDEKQKINELLNLISHTRFNNRDEFIKIGMALKAMNINYIDLYIEYSKQSKYYVNEKYIIDAWDSFKREGLSKFSLYEIAKHDNLKLFNNWFIKWNKIENIKTYENYINVNKAGFKEIIENSFWFSQEGTPHENNIFYDAKHIVLDAYMGLGKTWALIRLIKKKQKQLNQELTDDEKNKEIELLYKKINNHMKELFYLIHVHLECIKDYKKQLNDIILINKIVDVNQIKQNPEANNLLNFIDEGFEKIDELTQENFYNLIVPLKKEIKDLIENKQRKKELKILVLSCRITYANHVKAEFKKDEIEIHNYKEEKFNENNGYRTYNSIICSVESLHYIPDDKQFDFIVIDECESIFKQFSSTTTRQSEKSYHVLYNLVKNSNKIIYADAFITNRTTDFINKFNIYGINNEVVNSSKVIIKNITNKNNRNAIIYNHKNTIYKKLLNDVTENKKIYIVCTYKFEADNINKMLFEKTKINKEKILLYTANEDDAIKEGLLNINETWGAAQVIITTPLITVGNSYTNKDIDNVYIFAGPGSCCIRDTFQGHMRVRTNNGNLHVYLEDAKGEIMHEKFESFNNYKNNNNDLKLLNKIKFFTDDILNIFTVEQVGKLIMYFGDKIDDNILKILKNQINFNKNNEYGLNLYKQTKDFLKDKKDFHVKELFNIYETKLNEYNKYYSLDMSFLSRIAFLNNLEDELNKIMYKYIFSDFLNKCNYIIKNNTDETVEPVFKAEVNYNYDEIKNIDLDEFNVIIQKEKKSINLTKVEKQQKEKFIFNSKINIDENKQYLKLIYNDIYLKAAKKKYFSNSYLELLYIYNNKKYLIECYKIIEKNKLNPTVENNTFIKLGLIQQINKVLKIKNSVYTDNIIIDRKNIEINFIKWLEKDDFKNINEIEKVFNFTKKITKTDITFKKVIGLLNRIYDNWNSTIFFKNDIDSHTQKVINYKMENVFFEKTINETDFNIEKLFKFTSITSKNSDDDFID